MWGLCCHCQQVRNRHYPACYNPSVTFGVHCLGLKKTIFDPFTFDLAGQSGMWRQVGSVEVVFHARPRKHCCARAILKTSRGEFETAATLTPSSLAPLVVCNSAYFGMFGPKSVRSKERVRDSEHCLRKRSWRILTESVTMLCLV